MKGVVTRFPPSPTGYFHIGSARTALFNYLFAARHAGVMYLRFEDTDMARSKKEFEDDIIEGLTWLRIPYVAATPLRQSERLSRYREALHALIERGAAYEAEEGTKAGKVIRFKNPNVRITFSDLIRGDVSFDTSELKDFVIARNVDDPLYHLAVVTDDYDTGVTHVIRGEDHLSNTQRQILILEALGFERPFYAHISLILAPDRTKLSKRNLAASVNDYRRDGYLPEALINYLALLGWTPRSGKEKMSLEEMVAEFDMGNIHRSGAIFDLEKLQWLNRLYVLEMNDDQFKKLIVPFVPADWKSGENEKMFQKIVPLLRERTTTAQDLTSLIAEREFDYFFIPPTLEQAKIPQKGNDTRTATRHLKHLQTLFMNMRVEDFSNPDTIKRMLWGYATEEGRGNVLWPLRYALTGKEKSPDPFVVASYLGKEKVTERIQTAIEMLT